jgi:hypothetical protein
LALRSWKLPPQRGFQPPPLGFAAFDHLFPPNQMAQRITPRKKWKTVNAVSAVIAKAKLAGTWREKPEQTKSGPVIVEVNWPNVT